ncbi:MAG: VTT domain-containing protein [Gemmatimonadales bacterium]|nr:VTT domain-containing protein [Gemmatimonadales bacterium]
MTLNEVTKVMVRGVQRTWQVLVQPRGSRAADLVLRSTAVIALLGYPLTFAFPRLIPLIWLAIVSLPASGPLGPIMPAALEPVVMEAAKYERPIWVTLVALTTYVYMEYLNWHIYRWVLDRDLLSRFRDHRRVRTAVRYFARYPFATTVIAAATPFPCWVIRVLAVLHGYPLRPYLIAIAIGRFPRIYLYAWLGGFLRIPTVVLLAVVVGSTAVVLVHRLVSRRRRRSAGGAVPTHEVEAV